MTEGEPLIRWDWIAGHLDEIAFRLGQHLEAAPARRGAPQHQMVFNIPTCVECANEAQRNERRQRYRGKPGVACDPGAG